MCYRCTLKHRFSKLGPNYLQGPPFGVEGKGPGSIGKFNNKNFACLGEEDWGL